MAKAKEVKKEVTQEASTAPTPEEQIEAGNEQLEQLTVNDLIVIKNVFDVCSARGAFKAEEFQTVGQVYTKLSNFLNTIMPPPAEGESAEEPKAEEETQGES